MKNLRLLTLVHFEIVKIEFPSTLEPRIVGE